jgi:hypothetical protein
MIYYFTLHSHFHTSPTPLPPGFPMEVGWGNGYVLLPPGHPLHSKHYDDIEAYVHGGLTFASKYIGVLKKYKDSKFDYQMDEDLAERVKGGYSFLDEYWCIGFDTGHYDDDLITCPKEYVWSETQKLHKICVENNLKTLRRSKLNKLNKLKNIKI